METISRESAEHYIWGEVCQGWRLVSTDGLSVIEEIMPPESSEQIHRHHVAQQFFYVLCGEAVMEFAQREVAIKAGQGVQVSAGVPHRILNASAGDVRFLVISQPSTRNGDRENLGEWPDKTRS